MKTQKKIENLINLYTSGLEIRNYTANTCSIEIKNIFRIDERGLSILRKIIKLADKVVIGRGERGDDSLYGCVEAEIFNNFANVYRANYTFAGSLMEDEEIIPLSDKNLSKLIAENDYIWIKA